MARILPEHRLVAKLAMAKVMSGRADEDWPIITAGRSYKVEKLPQIPVKAGSKTTRPYIGKDTGKDTAGAV
jgi:hypothetical protein